MNSQSPASSPRPAHRRRRGGDLRKPIPIQPLELCEAVGVRELAVRSERSEGSEGSEGSERSQDCQGQVRVVLKIPCGSRAIPGLPSVPTVHPKPHVSGLRWTVGAAVSGSSRSGTEPCVPLLPLPAQTVLFLIPSLP